jgi:hypothetical protein
MGVLTGVGLAESMATPGFTADGVGDAVGVACRVRVGAGNGRPPAPKRAHPVTTVTTVTATPTAVTSRRLRIELVVATPRPWISL